MLDKLRRNHYKAIGLKENDYYGSMSDEKKQKIVANLTKEQKTVIRRDYLYSHLTERTNTVSDVKGGLMLAFAKQHLPEKTATIEATHKEEYGKKNARLDERIAGLKKAEETAKSEVKAKKEEQTAKTEKPTKITPKEVTQAKKSDTATAPKAEPKKEAKPTPKTDKVLIVGVPKRQSKAETVAV